MTAIVAADIGGTHARFALAEVAAGRVVALGEPVTLATADHASLAAAWQAFAATLRGPPPRAAAIAVAAPVGRDASDELRFTNNRWTLRPDALAASLRVERVTLVNDFAAQAHAVAELAPGHFRHLCGPDRALGADETITVVGPGTGLGVALLLRHGGRRHVVATEGGHIGFAPHDALEDALLADLRARHGRVSAERVVSGPSLAAIRAALARAEGVAAPPLDDAALWSLALADTDRLAAAALDRFCGALGGVAGDLALAHGADAVVIAGGLGLRLADRLPHSPFARHFADKGRFAAAMRALPVHVLVHDQPGLYGAAAAFAQEHPE